MMEAASSLHHSMASRRFERVRFIRDEMWDEPSFVMKKIPNFNGLLAGHGGRGRDSNPRYGCPVCRISSAVHSTTLPPLQAAEKSYIFKLKVFVRNVRATQIATEMFVPLAAAR